MIIDYYSDQLFYPKMLIYIFENFNYFLRKRNLGFSN